MYLLLVTVLFSLILPRNSHNRNLCAELQPYTEVQPQAATGSITAGLIAPHANAQFS
jgi:peroxin-14